MFSIGLSYNMVCQNRYFNPGQTREVSEVKTKQKEGQRKKGEKKGKKKGKKKVKSERKNLFAA